MSKSGRGGPVRRLRERLGDDTFARLQGASLEYQRGDVKVAQYHGTAMALLGGDADALLALSDRLPDEEKKAQLKDFIKRLDAAAAAANPWNRSPAAAPQQAQQQQQQQQQQAPPAAAPAPQRQQQQQRVPAPAAVARVAGAERCHVVWYKTTDLRIDDHAPLRAAHAAAVVEGCSVVHVLPLDSTLWFDPARCRSREARLPRLGPLRARFILEAIADLRGRASNESTFSTQLKPLLRGVPCLNHSFTQAPSEVLKLSWYTHVV